jgi:hypothetical protein
MRALGAALIAVALAGCAMLGGGTPATNPDPKQWPCGPKGTECTDTMPHSCCPAHGVCKSDNDGPFCEFDVPDDPADPTMLARRRRTPREDIR